MGVLPARARLGIGLAACAALAAAQADPAPAPGPRTRALLVGCNEYPYLTSAAGAPGVGTIRLRGPANDVELFARTLREVFAVPDAAMTRLAGWPDDEAARPTKANIVRALRDLERGARAGDWAVVYLAGHGSQQPSRGASLDDEPDGLDEIFLPSDVRPAPDGSAVPNALTDDEIAELLGRIRARGAEVWLVVDACHSGTLLRGGDWTVRGLPAQALGLRGAGGRPTAVAARAQDAPSADGLVAFYGAQSFGSAPEMELPEGAPDAAPHGLFTYLLVREMRRAGGSVTYSELAQRVVAAYQAFPCHLTVPLAEGDLQRTLGGGERAATPPLLLHVGAGPPRLSQGLLAGIEPGVQLDVAAPETPAGPPVARVEVTSAGLYEAECALRSGALPESQATLRAQVAARGLGGFRLTLAVVAADETPLSFDALPAAARDALRGETARFQFGADPARADWRIVVDGARLHLRAADHAGLSDRFDVTPAALRPALERLLKVHNLRRLCGLYPATDGAVDVWVERRAPGAREGRRLAPRDVLHPGDEVRVLLTKHADSVCDVTVLYLDANYGVQCLFPEAGRSARLEREANREFGLTGWIPVTDDALGVESLWVLAVPRGPADPEVNLSTLAQDQVPLTRGLVERSAAARVLEDLSRGVATRGLSAPAAGAPAEGRLFQVPVTTAWPPLGPPAWGDAKPAELAAVPRFLEDLPVALDPGGRWALAASGARGVSADVLLLGDEAAPRVVLLDFGRGGARGPDDFEPEAALALVAGSGAVALYDRRDRGACDLVLADGDGDGWAERRWTRGESGWILQDRVRTPLVSQSHLTFVRDKPDATTRLRVLARE